MTRYVRVQYELYDTILYETATDSTSHSLTEKDLQVYPSALLVRQLASSNSGDETLWKTRGPKRCTRRVGCVEPEDHCGAHCVQR